MFVRIKYCLLIAICLFSQIVFAQGKSPSVELLMQSPPESAKPWVFWYWMHAAVSKEGITADLEAMKKVGIGGAYLMPIQDTNSTRLPYQKPARQLTPEWWAMVNHAMKESKRLGLKLAMHVSDGFALAGGPWITPELSMQKLVWTKTYVKGGNSYMVLPQPETKENFYKDVAVFAFPANSNNAFDDVVMIPRVTTSTGAKAQFLVFADENNKQAFRSDTACWIQYSYPRAFTCKSIKIHVGGNNYQAQRLIIQSSDDGVNFKTVTRLNPPRHGWQDTDEDYTYSIPATTAKYFRFIYNKEGSEPGSEDLDAAKWKPSFKVMGIYLSDEPVINAIEAKNGSVWRVAENTTDLLAGDAIALKEIINLSGKLKNNGTLDWTAPQGNWVVIRIGHTSTGHTNATGGGGKGLECDKFNKDAIKLQFNNWFAKAFEKTDQGLAKEVLKIFHVDSWECGSQNWSTNFAAEFKKRRGYDLVPYLLTMTGVPVESAATSEKVLHDVRETIAELNNDIFYKTLRDLAHEKGCTFTAESIAPTMVSDGLLHYKIVDVPMGEFWLNSPTHDKPNDMFDAISGAHIYGKNIIQSESFTTLRMDWSEHPGSLKTIADRNFAMGVNKMVLHVWAHNPFLNRKPGVTLDGVGLYYQRDQTWFNQSKPWIDYMARVSAILQQGKPVVDIAVFTGEEVPRRSVLPDRLVNTLPGIFGEERVESEKIRLANIGQPLRQKPDGVIHSANMADPENWVNALRGYKYDCFNPDVLMQMTVKNGKVVTSGGAEYAILVFPGKHKMQPNPLLSIQSAKKITQLVKDGAKIIMPKDGWSVNGLGSPDSELKKILSEIFNTITKKGNVIKAPYHAETLVPLGLQRDVEFYRHAQDFAWTHRRTSTGQDIYFVSNQKDVQRNVGILFRSTNKNIKAFDAVSGKDIQIGALKNRNQFEVEFEPNQSLFFVFDNGVNSGEKPVKLSGGSFTITSPWQVKFDTAFGGPQKIIRFDSLKIWNENIDDRIKYYSGDALYTNTFVIDSLRKGYPVLLKLSHVYNIASVKINGIDCGTIWTTPYQLDIAKAVKIGQNKIEIIVSNTWANRLIGDQKSPAEKRVTWTTAPFRLEGKPLLPAGLEGEVRVIQ